MSTQLDAQYPSHPGNLMIDLWSEMSLTKKTYQYDIVNSFDR